MSSEGCRQTSIFTQSQWDLTFILSFGRAIWQNVSGCKAGHTLWPWNSTSGTYSKGIMREAHKIYI